MNDHDDANHLSIGEVLAQLQSEFPDVTISKIRFLESQGLINPERTPSGYRKFLPADVARLRWILVEQRDHFLPLKVIKERLEAHDPATGELPLPTPPADAPANAPGESAPSEAAPPEGAPADAPARAAAAPPVAAPAPARPARARPAVPPPPDATAPAPAPVARPTPPSSLPSVPTPTPTTRAAAAAPGASGASASRPARVAPARIPAEPEETPDVPDTPVIRRRTRDMTLPLALDGEPPADDEEGPDTFDRVALARAADVTEAILDELESYGVIKPFHDDGIRAFYDRDALVCVQAASRLAKHGIQPRHLKMYVHFTEREGGLFHQVLAPYLRQRNPVSRAKVDETLLELVTEARALRGALLRRAIEDALGE